MINSQQTQYLLNAGYEVYSWWTFNSTSDTGSIGHVEYVTYAKRDNKIFLAANLKTL